jgi:Met-zincin
LNKQLFATPSWLINNDIYSRTGLSGLSVIGNIQDNMLNRLLSVRTLNKLVDAESAQGNNAYQVIELLNDLKKGIWSELPARKPVDIYRRNLQKSYISILSNIINPPTSQPITIAPGITINLSTGSDKSDIISVVRAHLAALKNEVNAAAVAIADPMTKYHLQDVSKRIDKALNPKD